MKMATPPEHEFLVIKTADSSFDKRKPVERTFILERAQGENDTSDEAASRDKKKYEKIKEVASASEFYAAFVDSSPKELLLMEEGTVSITQPSPSTSDKMTVLSTKLLNASSESNDKFQNHFAEDVFLGEDYVYSMSRHAENLRHFKPGKELTLFDLAILAHTVHEKYPKYTVLKQQCFFFSGIIYFAILIHCGLHPAYSSNHEGIVGFDKSGRWNNLKLFNFEEEQIKDVVSAYEVARTEEFAKVFLTSFIFVYYN